MDTPAAAKDKSSPVCTREVHMYSSCIRQRSLQQVVLALVATPLPMETMATTNPLRCALEKYSSCIRKRSLQRVVLAPVATPLPVKAMSLHKLSSVSWPELHWVVG